MKKATRPATAAAAAGSAAGQSPPMPRPRVLHTKVPDSTTERPVTRRKLPRGATKPPPPPPQPQPSHSDTASTPPTPPNAPNAGKTGGGEKDEKRDTTRLYTALGLDSKTATIGEIKKAFRTLAQKHHPDKGGDKTKFQEVSRAYEVLSDAGKKELYDKYGEAGVEFGGDPDAGGRPGSGGSGDPLDILGILMNGGGGIPMRGGGGGGSAKPRGRDVMYHLQVTLEELYLGTSKKLKLTRNIACVDCKGSGGTNSKVCTVCKAQGVVIRVRQVGPGMIQQVQSECDKCYGKGHIIAPENECKVCQGGRTVKESKILEVFVEKGAKHGDRLRFAGVADEFPGTTAGDVVVQLQQIEHKTFTRRGNHLTMRVTVSLREALCGYRMKMNHLDGRRIDVQTDNGDVLAPRTIRRLVEYGMPHKGRPFDFGNLYVEFDVQFPTAAELSLDARRQLAVVLKANEKEPDAPADDATATETAKATATPIGADPSSAVAAAAAAHDDNTKMSDASSAKPTTVDDTEKQEKPIDTAVFEVVDLAAVEEELHGGAGGVGRARGHHQREIGDDDDGDVAPMPPDGCRAQ